jgi:sortase (surface protein transpeptidase)
VPTTGAIPPTYETTQPAPIPPAPVTRLQVPAIEVDAAVVPVDSRPTGKKNAWGGDVYGTIEFPVDDDVRQWIRRGDPNNLPAAESTASKAFDRVVLYGHASDIGNHLVFQDLSALRTGDSIVATTDLGAFTYRVTLVASNAKYDLNNFAPLYDYPADGAKEIALVACLPDTTSNVVVIGTLVAAEPA